MKEFQLENVVFQINDNNATIIIEKLVECPVSCTIESAREIYKALKAGKITNRAVLVRQSVIARMVREMEMSEPEYDWVTVDATCEKRIAGGSTVWIVYIHDDVIFERHVLHNSSSGFSINSAIKSLNQKLEPWKIKAVFNGEVKEVFVRSVRI